MPLKMQEPVMIDENATWNCSEKSAVLEQPAARAPVILSAGSGTIAPIFGAGQTPGHCRICWHSEGAAMQAAGQGNGKTKAAK